jgi:hypothetical protein
MSDSAPSAPAGRCHLCGSSQLEIAHGYSDLKRVTSDCKPWRAGGLLARCADCGLTQTVVNDNWRNECNEIYQHYTIYHQSCGVEQSVFAQGDGKSSLRSDRIVECLLKQSALPGSGRALDLGCGNGAFLRAFSKQAPQWQLYGNEFDAKNIDSLRAIANFKEL